MHDSLLGDIGLAERTAVLDEGRIVAVGTPRELMPSADIPRACLGLDEDTPSH